MDIGTDGLREDQKKDLENWTWPYAGRGELLCPHGVGHGGIHGCDGCCNDPAFKEAYARAGRDRRMK